MIPRLVIVAISGRALAQSTAKTGRRLVVLDAFGDRDTRAMAEVVCVGSDEGVAIDPGRLMAALAAEPRGSDLAILVGSGFEGTPELASRLARYGQVYANDPAVVAALKDPELGIALLRGCGWRVPATQRELPAERHGWLQKEAGAAGGTHVRRAGHAHDSGAVYFQREIPGQPLSVTFLADGDRAYCLGFNRLLVEVLGDARYCYAGAIAGIDLPPDLRAQAQSCLDRLVRVTGLRGLGGLDFLLDGERMTALEVNPRPTATFELYDDDFPEGLVHWHLASFERPVPEFGERLGREGDAARNRRRLCSRSPHGARQCLLPDLVSRSAVRGERHPGRRSDPVRIRRGCERWRGGARDRGARPLGARARRALERRRAACGRMRRGP